MTAGPGRNARPSPVADPRRVDAPAAAATPRRPVRPRPWSTAGGRGAIALLVVLLVGTVWGGGALHGQHLVLWDSKGALGIVACGQCLVILTGGIDLSVGAVLALCGTAFAGLMVEGGWSWPYALAATLLLGGLVGALNGTLIATRRLQPFLVTLATMVMARGFARFLPQIAGKPAGSKFMPHGSDGPAFWHTLTDRVLGMPVTGLLFAATAAVLFVTVRQTVFGRHLRAIGGNEEAARLSGVAVARTKIATYVVSSMLAALAGVVMVARDQHGDPGGGEQLELQTIAAVVIGGTSLQGGRGGIGLAVLGVFTIAYIEKILSLNAVEPHWQLVIEGCIILLAVMFMERRR